MLHGDIKSNDHEIGRWKAVRAGSAGTDGEFIYRCDIDFTYMNGYSDVRRFFVLHSFRDGAAILASKVLTEGWTALQNEKFSEGTMWSDFCSKHEFNPYILLD